MFIDNNFTRSQWLFSLACYDIVLYFFYSESNGIFCNFLWAKLKVLLLRRTSIVWLIRIDFFCALVIMNPMVFLQLFMVITESLII